MNKTGRFKFFSVPFKEARVSQKVYWKWNGGNPAGWSKTRIGESMPAYPVIGGLASNKLLPGFMDTTINEILAAAFIFAAANMLFFEARKFLKNYLNQFKSLQDPQDFENGRLPHEDSSEIQRINN
jgi:hypothetical protein